MNYCKVPTPLGGFAQIFPCITLFCASPKAFNVAAGKMPLEKCGKFLGNGFSYELYNTKWYTSVDTRISIETGCPNGCIVCNDCAQAIQQSPCTSDINAAPTDVTVGCVCGENTSMLGLEGRMTQKGLPVTAIVLQLSSPVSLKRNVSRSKELEGTTAPAVSFTIANFPDTDNGTAEIEDFLEQRLQDVPFEAVYNVGQKLMTLHFESADGAAQGRKYFNELTATGLSHFADICMQSQPGALELCDVLGVKRTLAYASPAKNDYDLAPTPQYGEESAKKVRLDHNATLSALDQGSQMGSVLVKSEIHESAHIPAPHPHSAAATTVDTTMVVFDILSALDTDAQVLVSGQSLTGKQHLLPLSLKVHPDIEKVAPEVFKNLRALHLKHIESSDLGHVVLCSFSFASKYFPAYLLMNTLYVGTPREAKSCGSLPTHLHDICWCKSTYDSKALCRKAWDQVMNKSIKLRNRYAPVPPQSSWPKHTVVDPTTNIPLRGPNNRSPWIVTVPLPFIEGTYSTNALNFNSPFLFLPEPKSHCPCTYVHWGSRADFVKEAPALLLSQSISLTALLTHPDKDRDGFEQYYWAH